MEVSRFKTNPSLLSYEFFLQKCNSFDASCPNFTCETLCTSIDSPFIFKGKKKRREAKGVRQKEKQRRRKGIDGIPIRSHGAFRFHFRRFSATRIQPSNKKLLEPSSLRVSSLLSFLSLVFVRDLPEMPCVPCRLKPPAVVRYSLTKCTGKKIRRKMERGDAQP